MKVENIVIVILIVGAGSLVAYFAILNWHSHAMSTPPDNMPHYNSTNSTDLISFLDLFISTNSTFLKTGQAIGIDITLNNTSSKALIANQQNMWELKGLGLEPCDSEIPFGIAILEGNYENNNMTEAKELSFYPEGIYHCQALFFIKSYAFQPLSDMALFETDGSMTNHSYELTHHFSLYGYFVGKQFHSFQNGQYTIVGGDEWGHVVIRHFVVGNSTG